MRFLIPFFCFFIIFNLSSQTRFESWNAIGLKREISKKMALNFDVNTRSYDYYFQLLYPEFTISYKLNKWIKPSLDYRLLYQRNDFGNYHFSNRLNVNLDLNTKIWKKIYGGVRVRYQNTFQHFSNSDFYNSEFDQAIRIKPSLEWKPKNSKISLNSSIELFYNTIPDYSFSQRLDKIRSSIGTVINLKGPNSLDIKYLYGINVGISNNKSQHIISLAYTFDWKKNKSED